MDEEKCVRELQDALTIIINDFLAEIEKQDAEWLAKYYKEEGEI